MFEITLPQADVVEITLPQEDVVEITLPQADVVEITLPQVDVFEITPTVEHPSRLSAEMLFVWMPLLATRWRRHGDDGEEMLFVCGNVVRRCCLFERKDRTE